MQNFESSAQAYWPTPTPTPTPRIERFFLGDYLDRIRISAAQISPAVAAALLSYSGKTLEELSKASETVKGFTPMPVAGTEVDLTLSVNRHTAPDRSVVALLEGSDPILKEEVVIISAHHDHEGADGAQVFNGADDNVSGTVAVIDIAEAYALAAAAGQRPKRSILFAVFGSEERGPLLGSWAYTEHPLRPLDKTAAVINMDMVGRNMEVPSASVDTSNPAINRQFKPGHFRRSSETHAVLLRELLGSQVGVDFRAPAPRPTFEHMCVMEEAVEQRGHGGRVAQ